MSGPVRLGTRWRRSRARTSLQRQVSELADRASPPGVTVWRVPPVVEVCTAIDYPAWRNARGAPGSATATGTQVRTCTWPERIPEGELAAVLLIQSHGGHWRGQPAEIAVPTFSHGVPAPGPDIEHPYEPLALALLIGWMKLALADQHQAALLAPPLIDVIGRVPKPRSRATSASPGRSSRASPTSLLAVTDEARPAPATRSCSTNRTKPASNSTRPGRTPTSSTWTSATNTHRRRKRAASRTRASRPRPPVRDGRPRRPASSSCAM